MATYMVRASFPTDAWANLCKHPEDRRAVVAKHMEVFGGKLLNFYYCFGDYDVVLISEAPNDTAFMAAMASSISATRCYEDRGRRPRKPTEGRRVGRSDARRPPAKQDMSYRKGSRYQATVFR